MTTTVIGADGRHIVPFTLFAQVLLSVALAVIAGLWLGQVIGVSVLLGGVTAFAPNAFLAARLMKAAPGRLMRSAWIGEIGKLLLTVVLFGAIFALVRPISPLAVFCGYIATHWVILVALFLSRRANDNVMTTS